MEAEGRGARDVVFEHLGHRCVAVVGVLLTLMVGTALVNGCEVVTPSPATGTPYAIATATPGSKFSATPTLAPTGIPSPHPMPTVTFTPSEEAGFAPDVLVLAALDVSPWFRERTFDWSPDSQAIAFFSPEGILWIARAPAFSPERLTEQKGRQPVWSPDGDQIAFVASREPEMHADTVWVVQTDGSSLRDLLPGERAIRSVSSGKSLGPWLDDQALIFMDACGTGCRTLVPIDVTTGEIQTSCGHGAQDPLVLGMDYHWSPSLDSFVVTEGGGIPRIRLVQLNHRHDCQEQDLPTPGEFHTWSPDGKAFLFSHWQCELGQGDPSPLIGQVPTLSIWDVMQEEIKWTGPEGGYEGAWSADGKHLAFFLLGNPRYEGQRIIGSDLMPGAPFPLFLVVLDVHTEEVIALVPLGEITDFYNYPFGIWHWFDQRRSVWAPDGKQLVYWGEDDNLWIMRRDGTNQQRLTEGLDIVEALWSPEGSRLAIATYDQLWIIERPSR